MKIILSVGVSVRVARSNLCVACEAADRKPDGVDHFGLEGIAVALPDLSLGSRDVGEIAEWAGVLHSTAARCLAIALTFNEVTNFRDPQILQSIDYAKAKLRFRRRRILEAGAAHWLLCS